MLFQKHKYPKQEANEKTKPREIYPREDEINAKGSQVVPLQVVSRTRT